MRFTYNNNQYELMEMREPNKNETFDIISIFKVVYWDNCCCCFVDKGEYDDRTDGSVVETFKFINYFYGVDDDIVAVAKLYIDTYDKKHGRG